tara:strand:+ start:1608 stop:1730 length:123 start_codon:yes stop_codon:yes gene_type:complete
MTIKEIRKRILELKLKYPLSVKEKLELQKLQQKLSDTFKG